MDTAETIFQVNYVAKIRSELSITIFEKYLLYYSLTLYPIISNPEQKSLTRVSIERFGAIVRILFHSPSFFLPGILVLSQIRVFNTSNKLFGRDSTSLCARLHSL